MPHVNIWIRKEDFPIWEAIKNKPEFIHNSIVKTTPDEIVRSKARIARVTDAAVNFGVEMGKLSNKGPVCKEHGIEKMVAPNT